jgi:hypothetical protein
LFRLAPFFVALVVAAPVAAPVPVMRRQVSSLFRQRADNQANVPTTKQCTNNQAMYRQPGNVPTTRQCTNNQANGQK